MEKKKLGVVSIIAIAILGLVIIGTLGLLAFGFFGAMTTSPDASSAAGWFIFVVFATAMFVVPYNIILTVASVLVDLCAKNKTIKTIKDIIIIILLVVPPFAFIILWILSSLG